MTKTKGQVVLLSDAKYLDQIRKIRLDIDHEIRDILDEYKALEDEVRKGGFKELSNPKKSYLNMLISIKKARVDAVAKQIQNAKDANEINMIIEGFKAEIERMKEELNDTGRSVKINRDPYSSNKNKE